MKYIIEGKSGAHHGNCTIGEGNTKAEAWLDALGPKPWPDHVKKHAKKTYWVTTRDE